MRFTKIAAIAGAVSILVSALPFNVAAANQVSIDYKIINDQAIITNVNTNGVKDVTKIEIPASITDGEFTYEVVGVEDFAFALCEDLEVICVPDSLTIANTGNVAFLTSDSVMNFLDKELSDAATTDDIVKYIAEHANYKNGVYTDEDLADVAVKLEKKLSMIDISVADTVEGKIMTLLRNVDEMNLNQELYDSFSLWLSTITYYNTTICANEGTEMQEYAKGREFLGLNFTPLVTDYVVGDANGDSKVNVRDAAYIASTIAKGQIIDPLKNPAADFNNDGKVNVRDAAALARSLAGN